MTLADSLAGARLETELGRVALWRRLRPEVRTCRGGKTHNVARGLRAAGRAEWHGNRRVRSL
jgi:hypothetical protein